MAGGTASTVFLGNADLLFSERRLTRLFGTRHPSSVDTLCNLPSDLPGTDATSTILTGSSDGYVRAVQLLPTKMLGVVADHRDWPVERIAVGTGTSILTLDLEESVDDDEEWHGIGKRKEKMAADGDDNCPASGGCWWVGSVGHENGLRLSDLITFFRGSESSEYMGAGNNNNDSEVYDKPHAKRTGLDAEESVNDRQGPEIVQVSTRRKRKQERYFEGAKKNAVVVEGTSFFGDL